MAFVCAVLGWEKGNLAFISVTFGTHLVVVLLMLRVDVVVVVCG